MSIFGHGPWANFLWGDVTYLTGKSVTGYAYRSVAGVYVSVALIVLASIVWFNGPNFPDTLTYEAEKEPRRNVSVVIKSLMKSIMKYMQRDSSYAGLSVFLKFNNQRLGI